MAIKYLRGVYGVTQARTTRPTNFVFPLGIRVSHPTQSANSANSATLNTFDLLVVAGGGNPGGIRSSGGGGGGGLRILSANSFTEIPEYTCINFQDGVNNRLFIPVTVGGPDSNSCFGSAFTTFYGGSGGGGGPGTPGGSGGGGGQGNGTGPEGGAPFPACPGGLGTAGQGCNGGTANPGASTRGTGGSACATGSETGLTSSFTGAAVTYSGGGRGSFANPGVSQGATAPANSGQGAAMNAFPGPNTPSTAASGRVAVRYRNMSAPTTPFMTGGDTVCCTGGCIIHIFNSSGFLNVSPTYTIN